MNAVGLISLVVVASQNVLGMGDEFDMGWIHASPVAAKVVAFQPFGNWSDKPLVGKAVSEHRLSAIICPATHRELCIAEPVSICCPFPAAVVENTDLDPETGRQAGVAKEGGRGKLVVHRKSIPFGVVGSGAYGVAAPFCSYYHFTIRSNSRANPPMSPTGQESSPST